MAFPESIELGALDGIAGFRLNGVADWDRSGWSVASVGDVNGDGFDDLIVGAIYADPNGYESGASYVVFGKASGFGDSFDLSSLDGTNGFRLNGAAAADLSGYSVASAGDVNGDGFDDLIVGAWAADPNGSASGASYVVFGQASGFADSFDLSTLDGTTGFRLNGAAAYDQSGISVASAGDVNGDGYDDLIVGAMYADPNGADSGASYVVFGKGADFAASLDLSTLDGTTGFRLNGAATADASGWSVSSAGDVNGDGYDDLIVGAPAASLGGATSDGASYVVFGKASGFASSLDLSTLDGTTGFRLTGVWGNGQFGRSVASAGDVNGDGYDDVIVGAKQAFGSANLSGVSYVVFGKASGFAASIPVSALDGSNGFKLNGEALGDQSGVSVASGGDVNGDGYDDLIVGASLADPSGASSGATYVVFGKGAGFAASLDLSDLDGTNGFRLTGGEGSDYSGGSVASAGDVNGDGYDDLFVGAKGVDANGPDSGASYVVFGGAFGDSTTPVTTTGTAAGEMLIGGAGDDVLTGGGGADVFNGGAGDDWLVVSDLGFREADGGSGTDTLALGGRSLVLDLTTALAAGRLEGVERIDLSGSGKNTLRIDSAAVLGGVGAVTDGKHVLTVLGNRGDTALFAEAGWTRTGSFDEGGILFDRWERGDAIVDIQQSVRAGATLTGGPGADLLNGSAGDDFLDGAAGADTMTGGTGNDTYYVDDAGDILVETSGEGRDRVVTMVDFSLEGLAIENLRAKAGAPGLVLTGNELANGLAGSAGDDTLNGGGGNDTLQGGAGEDTMTGGAGNDTYGVDNAGDVVIELAGGGNDLVNTILSTYALGANVEQLKFLGTGDFTGTGNELANTIVGGAGADTLDGGGGNDTLRGGQGADTMIGGDGNDTYGVDDAGDVIVELAGGGNDLVNTTLSTFTLGANVEHLKFLGTGDFTGTGNELANVLTGGTGNDTLDGGAGKDTLNGGQGNDTLIGGWGADKMTGGAGADAFVFRDALDSTRALRDTIVDFTVGTDSIDFTQMLTGGSFHALQTVTSAPVSIDAHSLVAFAGPGGNTVLYVNDTDTAQTIKNASMEILLKGVTTLSDADLDYFLI